jgi:predicted RNA-binding Zn-ribbon protein involved in translation (DUF1610 family)
MHCTACGKELRDSQQFCPKCGACLVAKSATPKPIQTRPNAGRTGFWFLAISIALLVVISGLEHLSKTDVKQNPQDERGAAGKRVALEREARAAKKKADLKLLSSPKVREACIANEDWDFETCQQIDEQRVRFGMTRTQVRLSWGKPEEINATTSALGEHEQWVYGSGTYLYFENGVLTDMQTREKP